MGTRTKIEVRPIRATDACSVRAEVLRPHWTPERCNWPFDHDPLTLHLGGLASGELAGVASFIPDPKPELLEDLGLDPHLLYKLRGMATREQYRSRGVGSAVLDEGMRLLRERGVAAVWCNARVSAQRFYERHGYVSWGEVFDNPPVGPHIVMWVRL
jgi:ribosomal protein S18 acetylase RimI-like enzyme